MLVTAAQRGQVESLDAGGEVAHLESLQSILPSLAFTSRIYPLIPMEVIAGGVRDHGPKAAVSRKDMIHSSD